MLNGLDVRHPSLFLRQERLALHDTILKILFIEMQQLNVFMVLTNPGHSIMGWVRPGCEPAVNERNAKCTVESNIWGLKKCAKGILGFLIWS
jgi:hypothetical protein